MDNKKQEIINTGRKLIKDLEKLQKRIEKKRKSAFFELNRVEDDGMDCSDGDSLFDFGLNVFELVILIVTFPKTISDAKTKSMDKKVKKKCQKYTNELLGCAPEMRQYFKGSYLPFFFTNQYRKNYKDISRVNTKILKERYKQEKELVGMVIEELQWNISVLEKSC